ncbi:putative N-acetyltransferase san OS=Drosophila melanogaster GN=san PE=1 SV=1 [Rhizoctonia solani AG-1 IB]|uniref:Putative N-acetyltransferase san n=1 Tax=Thanatephorus cucumeris (strain AG1-IB / isolate 7/3/14) TaxID=1108050 RepID=A0A0B7F679_THACB|nr:putative N-acetyltransferase san OS=Drosophila melanogaster GN=san PE=1 SV=1 [Rhizoctonia solani AG-1 IB]
MSSAAIVDVAISANVPVPIASPVVTLSERLSFVSLSPDNLDILKSLNAEIFPVPYPDAYYAAVVKPELARFCKLIYLDGSPVGQATCSLKPSERVGEARIYGMLMGVLPPYRSLGIGSYAGQHLLDAIAAHNSYVRALQVIGPITPPALSEGQPDDPLRTLATLPITSIFMHVHVLNTGARRLYERYGFTERKRLENFYRRKGPDDTAIKDAWVFERDIDSALETLRI